MRVLVTGASGFLGRHALAALLEAGHEVVATYHRSPGAPRERLRWVGCNLLERQAVHELVAGVRADRLLHLGWRAVYGDVSNSPDNTDWLVAGIDLARAFLDAGGRRIVGGGTCFEYDWGASVCSEDSTPLRPATHYGACKVALQAALAGMTRIAGASLGWARVFFAYGPGEHDSRLVAWLAMKMLRGEPAEMTHGRQVRDYVYAGDVAQALRLMVESDDDGEFNVGTGEAMTLREIGAEIAAQIGRADLLRLGARSPQPYEPPTIVADTRRIRATLGWQPRTSLAQGIAASIEAIRERERAGR